MVEDRAILLKAWKTRPADLDGEYFRQAGAGTGADGIRILFDAGELRAGSESSARRISGDFRGDRRS